VSIIIHTRVFQEKLYEEMTTIFEGSDQQPTRVDLEQMKYLNRGIKETLRLYPNPSSIGRLTETDIQIGELRNAVFVSRRFIPKERARKARALWCLIVFKFIKTGKSIVVFEYKQL
jgi:hypothetical protein